MEDNKKLIIVAGVMAALIILTIVGISVFFYFSRQQPSDGEQPGGETNENSNANGVLPAGGDLPVSTDGLTAEERIAKDKQFISVFWEPVQFSYQAESATYELPLASVKEQVANYRDFTREIDLEPYLDRLAKNGFVIIGNPFDKKVSDWETAYSFQRQNDLPTLITADSMLGIYQDTLQIVYKELEQDIFFPSLWDLMYGIFSSAKERYLIRSQQLGIESDIITEANRLEMAYAAVALKLLEPEPGQVRDIIGEQQKYFSKNEQYDYSVELPLEIESEVKQELSLIGRLAPAARSPIFNYEKSYAQYKIPSFYQSSEKLKNYYLAVTWLNDILFPLWNQENDCSDCSFDLEDHTINFAASLYLSSDLASDQTLKNRWANIYKSISFFKGLESNLTFLNYDESLKAVFGEDYLLEKYLAVDPDIVREYFKKVQEQIVAYSFPEILTSREISKKDQGLRLLRNYYLLENKIFDQLSGPAVGSLTFALAEKDLPPITGCKTKTETARCLAIALDLFNVLENGAAKAILDQTQNSSYQNYSANLDYFKAEVNKFDKFTWHNNSYFSLLKTLKEYENQQYAGFPAFMAGPEWKKKVLNASLGAWVDFHQEISFDLMIRSSEEGAHAYFPYGYVEPEISLYSELLSNIDMMMDGFSELEIINPLGKSFYRLNNLKILLEKIVNISIKELQKQELDSFEYNLINDLSSQIKGVTGDVRTQNIQNNIKFEYQISVQNKLVEAVEGLDYAVVIYPDKDGKLFLALGPVYNYSESKNNAKINWQWINDIKK